MGVGEALWVSIGYCSLFFRSVYQCFRYCDWDYSFDVTRQQCMGILRDLVKRFACFLYCKRAS